MRPLRASEVPTAAATLARAFHRDPLFGFLLPEERRRRAWLEWFHTLSLREALAVDGAYTFDSDAGPSAGAVALVPPGRWPVPAARTIAAVPLPRALPTPRLLTAGVRLWRAMGRLHPPGEQVYVIAIGVDPRWQGQGLGGVLLHHACALADGAAVPGYLETGNPVNVGLYERFGFRLRDTVTSHAGPPLWTMSRPRAA